MKYSVIIPAYNCVTTLAKTVSSIQACGLPDYEIILVDDGSTDGTSALCDRLSAEYPDIRCFHQENQGVSAARNHGLDEARGDYVWFFDSDDLVDPGSMTRAAQIVEEHQPDMMIFGMSFDFTRDGKLYDRWLYSFPIEKNYSSNYFDEIFQKLYQTNSLTSSCNKLMKKSVLTNNAIRYDSNLQIMEDFLFVLNVLENCRTIYTSPQIVYRYSHPYEKSGKKDNAVVRVSQIDNLEEYLSPFRTALENHPETMSSLYYMLLEQRLRYQKPKEIVISADHFLAGPYSSGIYYDLCPPVNKAMAGMLRKRQIFRLYLNHRLRRILVSLVKRTSLYRFFKSHRRPS